MSPWWLLLGPLSQCFIFKSCHYNSFEDQAPVDFIYRCLIFKWVPEISLHDRVPVVIPAMTTRQHTHIYITNNKLCSEVSDQWGYHFTLLCDLLAQTGGCLLILIFFSLPDWSVLTAGIILGMASGNKRWGYIIMVSIIGWVCTQNDVVLDVYLFVKSQISD